MVLPVVRDPRDDVAFDRHLAQDRKRVAHDRVRLERTVREQAVVADRDAEPGQDVADAENDQLGRADHAAPEQHSRERHADEREHDHRDVADRARPHHAPAAAGITKNATAANWQAAACDDECVEDLVVAEYGRSRIRPAERVHDCSRCVERAPGERYADPGRAGTVQQLRDHDDPDRPEREPDGRVDGLGPRDAQDLRRGCCCGAGPDGDQHEHLPPPGELEERVRRVRACDEHVDHRVIDAGHPYPVLRRPRDPVVHGADPEHRARAGGEKRRRHASEGGRCARDEQDPQRQRHEEGVVVHDAAEPRFDARRRFEISRSRGEPPSSPRLRLLARTIKSCPNATHRPPSWLLSRVAAPLPRGRPRKQSLRPKPHPKSPCWQA